MPKKLQSCQHPALGPHCFPPAGFIHSRPEPLYFWFYFVVINAIWIVVPFLCLSHAWAKISEAVGKSGKPKAKRR